MKKKRLLLRLLAFFLLLLVGTWVILKQSGLPKSYIQDVVSPWIRGKFHLGEVSVDPIGGEVRVRDISLGSKKAGKTPKREVLKVKEVVIGVSMNPMSNLGEVQTIHVTNPEIDLHLGDDNPIDLNKLLDLDQIAGSPGGGNTPPPAIEISGMVLRIHFPGEKRPPVVLQPIQLRALPQAGEESVLLLEGQCPHPFGGSFQIQGRANTKSGNLRLIATTQPFHVDAKSGNSLGPRTQAFLEKRRFDGMVNPTLWLDYSEDTGVNFGARATFKKLKILPPTLPFLLTGLEGVASFSSQTNTLQGKASRKGTDYQIQGSLELKNPGLADEALRLSATAKRVLLDQKLKTALREIPATREVLDAFQPKGGRAEVSIFLRSGLARKSEEPKLQLDIGLENLDLNFRGFAKESGKGKTPERGPAFPYPLNQVYGRIRVRDTVVRLEDIRGRSPLGGAFRIEGDIVSLEETVFSLSIRGKDVPFRQEVRDALERAFAGGGKTYDAYAPEGRADIFCELRTLPGREESTSFRVEIRPKGASAEWEGFPYRVRNLGGNILIDNQAVRFDLGGTGTRDSRIQARGNFEFGEDAPGGIHIIAQDLNLDPELRRGLAGMRKDFDEKWALFSPKGKTDLDFLGWYAPKDPTFHYDIRIDLAQAQGLFRPFPTPVDQVRGSVFLHGDGENTRTDLMGLKGKALGADLLFEGTVWTGQPSKEGLDTDIRIVAKGLQLDDRLAEVLDETQLLSRAIWNLTEPKGSVDLVHHIRRTKGEADFEQELEVDLRGLVSTCSILPDQLDRVSGTARIDKDRVVHIDNAVGYIGEAQVFCHHALVSHDGEKTRIHLEISADSYPVDSRLARLLDGDVKKAFLERRPRGRASVNNLKMDLEIPDKPPEGVEGMGLTARIQEGLFFAQDLRFQAGIEISNITGRLMMTKGILTPWEADFRGEIRNMGFSAMGQRFENAEASFVLTQDSFEIPKGRARFHRGWIRGPIPRPSGEKKQKPFLSYGFSDEGPLAASFTIEDVSLRPILAGLRTQRPYTGRLQGRMDLRVLTTDLSSLEIDANLGISDGNLGDVPVFRSIYGQLKPSKRQEFNAGILELEGKDKVLHIKRMMLKSPIFKIEGRGELGYDGYLTLNVDFPDLFPQAKGLFILPEIYRVLATTLVSYDIFGYLGDTKTGARLFLEGRPKRRPLGPLPGRLAPYPSLLERNE
ncbi:MAG TPA: hypothetical protein ENK02_08465 [Planctomycetes bacterium]|nr:hypothetical protein [Planctomycetota bacterium]